jgi:serine/threonine protein kinase
VGTPLFVAPEVYHKTYDEKVDLFSTGLVLLTVMEHSRLSNGHFGITVLSNGATYVHFFCVYKRLTHRETFFINTNCRSTVAAAVNAHNFDLEAIFLLATEPQRALIRQLLAVDPRRRPSALRALATVKGWTRAGQEIPITHTREFYALLAILVLVVFAWLAGF